MQLTDAGAEHGADYTSTFDDRGQQEAMSEIWKDSFFNGMRVKPIGTFAFTTQ